MVDQVAKCTCLSASIYMYVSCLSVEPKDSEAVMRQSGKDDVSAGLLCRAVFCALSCSGNASPAEDAFAGGGPR